jgi:RNA polymerase sigma-70 factor, ECF subfamily
MAAQTCSSVSNSTDYLTETIARIALADDQALAEFYDRTSSLVFSLVQRILDNPSVAEEITLDIYMQVWRQAKQYNPERAAPRTWLLMIARSRAIDELRSSHRQLKNQTPLDYTLLIDDSPNAEEIVAADTSRRILRSALESLTPSQREAIELAFYADMTHSEIASKLGKPLRQHKIAHSIGNDEIARAFACVLPCLRVTAQQKNPENLTDVSA